MKICTINLPEQYVEALETLVDLGYYPSRSEAVREALRQFLPYETDLMTTKLLPKQFTQLKKKQLEVMLEQ
jgi:Arc/MetJ-type ribon-helix-helix transcriptional regulator